jgi:hypothetical protein
VRNNYQRKTRKPNYKFEVVGGQELVSASALADDRGVGGDAGARGRTCWASWAANLAGESGK